MDLAAYDFALPPERIAQEPARPRDRARLLVVGSGWSRDCLVRDLPEFLSPGDLMVVNDTRVIPAELRARRGAALIGLTLSRPLGGGSWQALARNARRLRTGDVLEIVGPVPLAARVAERQEEGAVILAFDREGAALSEALARSASLALPPYIRRPAGPTEADEANYQTIFATHPGAIAAPTAGLHFTPALLAALAARGVETARVTLHVGPGTFLPLRDSDFRRRRLFPEPGSVSPKAAEAINAARARRARILAVGTTSLRLIESAADASGRLAPFCGETDLFILPGYSFRAADLLLTNFHLPRSSLLLLVCAFAGTERIRAAYAHAIACGYRFYSYGDATLLSRS